jgi:prepilin-type N-terminal cleavage/methylation domain-containing protein
MSGRGLCGTEPHFKGDAIMRAAIFGPSTALAPRRSTPRGFTLVELLVVITIIGMLMAMLFPAFATFWERANRMVCSGRLEDIAKNCQTYEQAKTYLPGWISRMPPAEDDSGM